MEPDYEALAIDLGQQLLGGSDTVRHLTRHWPSDGAHREGLLRDVIAKRLPTRFQVETGFVLTSSCQSRQIDILIRDSHRPLLQRSADGAVFITPDVAAGIIEVKSRLSGKQAYQAALMQLAHSAKLAPAAWTGLFVFEPAIEDVSELHRTVLSQLIAVEQATGVEVNCVAIGGDDFFRYWANAAEQADGLHAGPAWHSYTMRHLAPAYFVGNLVAALSSIPDEYEFVWFPIKRGKEMVRQWYAPANGEAALFPERHRY
jgi:hypothetical protein